MHSDDAKSVIPGWSESVGMGNNREQLRVSLAAFPPPLGDKEFLSVLSQLRVLCRGCLLLAYRGKQLLKGEDSIIADYL